MVDFSRLKIWNRGKRGADKPAAEKPPDKSAVTKPVTEAPTSGAASSAPATADDFTMQRKGKPDEIAAIAKRYIPVLKASKGLCSSALKVLSGDLPDGDKAPAAFEAWFESIELKGKEQHKDRLLFVIFYCTYLGLLILSDKLDWPTKAAQYGKLSDSVGDKSRGQLRLLLASVMQCTLHLNKAGHPGKGFTKDNVPKAKETVAEREALFFVAVFEEVRRKGPKVFEVVYSSRRDPEGVPDAFEAEFPALEYMFENDGSFERIQAMGYPLYCAMLIASGIDDAKAAKAFGTVAASIDPDAGKHMRDSAPGMLAVVLLLHSRKQLRAVSFSKSKPAAKPEDSAKDDASKPAEKPAAKPTPQPVIKPRTPPQEPDEISLDDADQELESEDGSGSSMDSAVHGVEVVGKAESGTQDGAADKAADTLIAPEGVLPGCEIPYDPDETYISDDDGNSVDAKGRIALLKGQRPDGTIEDASGTESVADSNG